LNEEAKNLAASVHRRRLNSARQNGEDFNQVLGQYAIERLLYRLGKSVHRDRFVLKGASLYAVWQRDNSALTYRPTRDLDLRASGSPLSGELIDSFRQVLTTPVPPDGLEFRPEEIRAVATREDQPYQGCRLNLSAHLGQARIPIQIDLGFGDAITPDAQSIEYPTRLGFPAPVLRAYPRETVVAEKFEALVSLSMANTRMKDFFDLWTLATQFEFEGAILQAAIKATFERRKTPLPENVPVALTPRFTADTAKMVAWRAFIVRNSLGEFTSLETIAAFIEPFLIAPANAAREGPPLPLLWHPQTGWSPLTS
jgi:hypothetical protein